MLCSIQILQISITRVILESHKKCIHIEVSTPAPQPRSLRLLRQGPLALRPLYLEVPALQNLLRRHCIDHQHQPLDLPLLQPLCGLSLEHVLAIFNLWQHVLQNFAYISIVFAKFYKY